MKIRSWKIANNGWIKVGYIEQGCGDADEKTIKTADQPVDPLTIAAGTLAKWACATAGLPADQWFFSSARWAWKGDDLKRTAVEVKRRAAGVDVFARVEFQGRTGADEFSKLHDLCVRFVNGERQKLPGFDG